MAISYVNGSISDPGSPPSRSTLAITLGFAVQAGDRIVVGGIWYDDGTAATTATVSDNVNTGNYYTIGSFEDSSDPSNKNGAGAWEMVNSKAAGSGTLTVTMNWSGASQYNVFAVAVYRGTSTIAHSYSFVSNTPGESSASPLTVSVVPATANDWCVAIGPYPANDDTTGAAAGCTLRLGITTNDFCGLVDRNPGSTSPTAVGFTVSGAAETFIMVGFAMPQPGGSDPIGFGVNA
jgi:hypothetical protein